MFTGMLSTSILKRAWERRLLQVDLVQIRDFAEDRHQRVDDAPFGGGPGMVLKADVLYRALQSVLHAQGLPPRDGGAQRLPPNPPAPPKARQRAETVAEKIATAGTVIAEGAGPEKGNATTGGVAQPKKSATTGGATATGKTTAMAKNATTGRDAVPKGHVIHLSPQGKRFDQGDARRLAEFSHVVLVCGHYEGVDERFVTECVHEELSLGDFVLTGGEIPAMAVMDAVSRFIPGVVGDEASVVGDSFYHGVLDHPHFTRPSRWVRASMPDVSVPNVLLSGDHGAVANWRRRQALLRTLIRRPDCLEKADLTRAERRLMENLAQDLEILDSKRENDT